MANARRIPLPPVANPPAPPIATDGNAATLDANLEPYADFALAIGSLFFQSYNMHDAMYDASAHRYRDSYVRPGSFGLYLDAQLGLRHAKAVAPNLAPARGGGRTGNVRVPTPDEEYLDEQKRLGVAMIRARDDQIGGTGTDVGISRGSTRLKPPKALLAYDWIIEHRNTDWIKHIIIQKPTQADTFLKVRLDGPGAYSIRMRVFFTRNRYTERNVTFNVTEKLLVGMGDSFASGEGNPDRWADLSEWGEQLASGKFTTVRQVIDRTLPTDRDADWLEKEAHRSLSPAQALAASMLQRVYGETWKPGGGQREAHFEFIPVTWLSFARSGAEIIDGLLLPQKGAGDFIGAGQVEECKRTLKFGQSIDALQISIGGNDAGFSGTLSDLTQGQSYWSLVVGPAAPDLRAERIKALNQALGVGLPAGQEGTIGASYNVLKQALDDLSLTAPIKQVFVTGYPEDLFYVDDGKGGTKFSSCGIFETASGLLSIDANDGEIIRTAAQNLNALIQRKCAQFGWIFVPTAPAFAGKGYCEGSLWIDADESAKIQADQRGTVHPSQAGHFAAAKLIHAELVRAQV